ncbi:acid phosphatase 1 [Prunus yedoensis var. nudiflora]|uniref:Acid phosphatase 1 n=1 Tax=Prunus yedoensis var. nudiflora TaxID=2094558 RepID=A0A314Z180_PRUYE|nr:acid phosphatase 1 [Prunus yedoensis var. nudiflora]
MASSVHHLLFIINLLIIPTTLLSQSIIQMPPRRHRITDDNLYCDSWRFSVETNDAGTWTSIPSRCVAFVQDYMTGDRYLSDSAAVANYSLSFARGFRSEEMVRTLGSSTSMRLCSPICPTIRRMDSGLNSYGHRSVTFDEASFDEWVDLAEAPALPASLKLYKELKHLGFKIFLLTGRSEHQRNATAKNLLYAGYNNWERLLLRGPSDQGTTATVYKSEKRSDLINEGYRIHGSSGDQWSDLLGFAVAQRSFKLPNPMYYIA